MALLFALGTPWRGPITVSGHPIDAVIKDLTTGYFTFLGPGPRPAGCQLKDITLNDSLTTEANQSNRIRSGSVVSPRRAFCLADRHAAIPLDSWMT